MKHAATIEDAVASVSRRHFCGSRVYFQSPDTCRSTMNVAGLPSGSKSKECWIAYTSNEGGQSDVYVQSFPEPGAKSQVSRDGGTHPVWRADGRELFYLAADGTMMAVPVMAGRSFDAGRPQALFASQAWTLRLTQAYAVTQDGQRFLVNATSPPPSGEPLLTVVLNWTAAIHK